MTTKPQIKIHYCTKCRWLMRAGWTAQELLSAFSDELGEVALCPSDISGRFDLELDGDIIWSRKSAYGFAEMKVLKQIVRNHVAPEKNLGHSDHRAESN